jgi:hypothetical protein
VSYEWPLPHTEQPCAASQLEAGEGGFNLLLLTNQHAQAIDQKNGEASDIEAFAFDHQNGLLRSVCLALQQLGMSQAYAERACLYAVAALPPASTPAIEPHESNAALAARQVRPNSCVITPVSYL